MSFWFYASMSKNRIWSRSARVGCLEARNEAVLGQGLGPATFCTLHFAFAPPWFIFCYFSYFLVIFIFLTLLFFSEQKRKGQKIMRISIMGQGGAKVKWGVWIVAGPRRQAQNTTSSLSLLLRARFWAKPVSLAYVHKNKILQHEKCQASSHDSGLIKNSS